MIRNINAAPLRHKGIGLAFVVTQFDVGVVLGAILRDQLFKHFFHEISQGFFGFNNDEPLLWHGAAARAPGILFHLVAHGIIARANHACRSGLQP